MNLIPFFLILFTLFSIGQKEEPAEVSPNILFLIADDWSYPHAGVYGIRSFARRRLTDWREKEHSFTRPSPLRPPALLLEPRFLLGAIPMRSKAAEIYGPNGQPNIRPM